MPPAAGPRLSTQPALSRRVQALSTGSLLSVSFLCFERKGELSSLKVPLAGRPQTKTRAPRWAGRRSSSIPIARPPCGVLALVPQQLPRASGMIAARWVRSLRSTKEPGRSPREQAAASTGKDRAPSSRPQGSCARPDRDEEGRGQMATRDRPLQPRSTVQANEQGPAVHTHTLMCTQTHTYTH